MALTQTQLDEAMKPEQFDSHSSVGDQNSSVSKPTMPSSSILTKDKSFSSAASPINSLLAGEKIQFGEHVFSSNSRISWGFNCLTSESFLYLYYQVQSPLQQFSLLATVLFLLGLALQVHVAQTSKYPTIFLELRMIAVFSLKKRNVPLNLVIT